MGRALRLALAAVLLFWAVADEAFAVTVRFSAELGRTTEAGMRPRAIDAGLASAVSQVAARHTDAGQRAELSPQLKAIVSRARAYVTRYSVVSEEAIDGYFNAKYSAEVDREGLLSALEGAGFKVYRLDAMPRVLIAPTGEPDSASAAKAAAALFKTEGIEAAVYDLPAESPEALSKIALARGYHLCLIVTLAEPPPTELDAPDAQSTPAAPQAPAGEDAATARVELAASATLFDARSGEVIGRTDFATVAEAADRAVAARDAVERGGDDLFEAVMGSLVKSGWKLGDTPALLRLRIAGLESPALALEFSTLFTGLAEFRKVEFHSVEARAATWSVRAVNPGNDWLAVLSRVKPSRGQVKWKAPATAATGGEPLLIEGQWLPR